MSPTTLDVIPRGGPLSFDGEGAIPPEAARLTTRDLFYHLVNVEEHPEVLPLAYDVASRSLDGAGRLDAVDAWGRLHDPRAAAGALAEELTSERDAFGRPWRHETADLTRRQVLHYFMQYMPTALVDGCWMQCGLRVSTAHTAVGGLLTGLYAHQVRAFIADPGRHFVADYRAAYGRLGSHLEEVSSRSFADREDFLDTSFALPSFLLSIGQFTRTFPGEILGLNLAWQALDLSAFGPALVRDLCEAYALPPLGQDLADAEYLEKARTMAVAAVATYLQAVEEPARTSAWERVVRGAGAGVAALTSWLHRARDAAPTGPPDPRQEMLDLLWRKAPHAVGYHADKALGSQRIDDHLQPATFDGPRLLADLARSPWVKPGVSDKSGMLKHLVKFGGPMLAVFSPVELKIIESWIDSLPSTGPDPSDPGPATPTVREPEFVSGRAWTRDQFQQRSQRRFGGCSVRELFYYLINVEYHPDILPVAERYAKDRLERSLAMLRKGERPIPSWRYDPVALEHWVHAKHREQVDAYRPPEGRPDVPEGSVHRSQRPVGSDRPHRRRMAPGHRFAGVDPHRGRPDALPRSRRGDRRGERAGAPREHLSGSTGGHG